MLTKLRPFIHTFLKEASSMFEMYVYTMGERSYALEMVKLLDPRRVYFSSRVISKADCTQRHQKGLDMVLGAESAVVILDDTEDDLVTEATIGSSRVWSKHRENLILMERYHFFSSSCRQFRIFAESLSELNRDECKSEGALASVLKVLKGIHEKFFDQELGANLSGRDVRQVIKMVLLLFTVDQNIIKVNNQKSTNERTQYLSKSVGTLVRPMGMILVWKVVFLSSLGCM
ncbi:RNA polymerase II C-terminal domain phosphatase-like 4 isoform X2 [Macadamia integrifolia]|uniref:RNA polymerase II C-terminal domain phosphatase-like 4 isoform X2 n=1 Tax=Macadamia integrifolia TaxID=60698 RepID=UPI001C4E4C5B|nr:RNA polymerase II C-terminal domain phosphatase-like 4 isoform X2 [Macadamia integrifolia]